MKSLAPRKSTLVNLLLFTAILATVSGCSADCSWTGKAQAFIDENANAKWDTGEPPLPDVRFSVVGSRGNSNYGSGLSDSTGTASMAFFVACNKTTNYWVYATPPNGYKLETPEGVDAGSESGKTFTFGFVRQK